MIRGMARSALLAGVILAYAALAMASATDREAGLNLTAKPGKTPLAAQASLQEARLALAANNADAALAAAWQGVKAAPVEPSATSLLASAYFMKGDTDAAFAAFKVARKLGWRDVATQAYWLSAGLAVEDSVMTAQHLDALMRGAPQLPFTRDVLVKLENTEAGRAALTERLREGPGWLTAYAVGAAELAPSAFAIRASLLRDAGMFNRRPDCQAASHAANNLAYNAGRYGDAYQLWQLACDPGRTALLGNADFARSPAYQLTPFDWSMPGAGGVSARIGERALVARNENPGLPTVAQQTVLLRPGSAGRLNWRARAENTSVLLDKVPALRCPRGNNLLERSRPVQTGPGTWQIGFTVPADCDYQRLELRLPREAGEVRIERVDLTLTGQQG